MCSVTDSMNPYVPECTGAVPANTKYLYVYVHGSVTPNINYAISVTFEKTSVPYMVSNILPCLILLHLDPALQASDCLTRQLRRIGGSALLTRGGNSNPCNIRLLE